jgi:hypothetical protein
MALVTVDELLERAEKGGYAVSKGWLLLKYLKVARG